MSDYTAPCPKCKHILEWNFAGNNGYFAFCDECKGMLYFCSIFGTVDLLKTTGEGFKMNWSMLQPILKRGKSEQ